MPITDNLNFTDIEQNQASTTKSKSKKLIFFNWIIYSSFAQLTGLMVVLNTLLFAPILENFIYFSLPVGIYFLGHSWFEKLLKRRLTVMFIYIFCLIFPFAPFLFELNQNNQNYWLISLCCLFSFANLVFLFFCDVEFDQG
jgi:hypothetical protein